MGFLKKTIIAVVRNAIYGDTNFSPKVQRILSKYGHEIINSIKIIRTPLSSFLTGIINIVSLGDFEEKFKNTSYDKLFHLYIIINTDKGNVSLEKNQRINMELNPSINGEHMDVIISSKISINQLIDNTHKELGNRFYSYQARLENCQDFIIGVLKGNNLSNAQNIEFVKQNTEQLFNDKLRKISNTTTDIARLVDVGIQGGTIENNILTKYKHKMHKFTIGLSKNQKNGLSKGGSVQLNHKQLSSGSDLHQERVMMKCGAGMKKRMDQACKKGCGLRIDHSDLITQTGGSIFDDIGDAFNKGVEWVKENAGEVVEGVKKIIPENLVANGVSVAVSSGLTALGLPEMIPLAIPAINLAVNKAYKHDFSNGKNNKKEATQPMKKDNVYNSTSTIPQGLNPIADTHNSNSNEDRLYQQWKREYLLSHPTEQKDNNYLNGYQGGNLKKMKKVRNAGDGILLNKIKMVQVNPQSHLPTDHDPNIQEPIPVSLSGNGLKRGVKGSQQMKDYMASIRSKKKGGCLMKVFEKPITIPEKGDGVMGKRPKKGSPEMKEWMDKLRSLKGKKHGGSFLPL